MSQIQFNQVAKIKVFGIGGGGCNAVSRMVEEGVQGVEFFVVNTDLQVLQASPVENKIILGNLGAGANPEVGRLAAEENEEVIREAIKGADMVYITAGLGGGTGTGAAPVFARIAKEMNALTVGIVTKPFRFEGKRRTEQAIDGLSELSEYVDSLIVVSNDQLLNVIGNIPLIEAFKEADSVLRQGVQTVTDLIAVPSLINLDFADVKSVMENQGCALIGIGMAQGDKKAQEAASKAIHSPLLEAQISGAKKAIINVTGGTTVSLQDANEAAEFIREAAGDNLDVIFGVSINEKIGDSIIVTVIATGFDMDTMNIKSKKVVTETPEIVKVEKNVEVEEDGDIPRFFRYR